MTRAASLRFFTSAAAFRRWLQGHHASAREVLVGFHKVSSDARGLTYREALDEALAYGWIDGVRKSVDAHSYTIRFSPRKPDSYWSAVNTARYRELLKAGRIAPPGRRAFEARDASKTAKYSFEREHAALDPALAAELRANDRARVFFDAQPPGYRKVITFWVMSARQEETRRRRLAILVEHSADGRRIDLMKPGR